MEERKTIFDYLGQIMTIFGVTMIMLNIICLIVGEKAKEVSDLFLLGGRGLAAITVFQFLLLSVFIILIRFVFFTDTFIKKRSLTFRTIGMLASIIILMCIFVSICNWFPVNMWQPWAYFLLCFGLCFMISILICYLKEKAENKAMQDALEKIKRDEI